VGIPRHRRCSMPLVAESAAMLRCSAVPWPRPSCSRRSCNRLRRSAAVQRGPRRLLSQAVSVLRLAAIRLVLLPSLRDVYDRPASG
jgi:hypothetical protein